MTSADCIVAGCRQLVTCRGPIPRRGDDLADLGILDDGWIASREGRIVFVGTEKAFRESIQPSDDATVIEGEIVS